METQLFPFLQWVTQLLTKLLGTRGGGLLSTFGLAAFPQQATCQGGQREPCWSHIGVGS